MPTALTNEILVKCNVNLYGHGDRIIVFAQSIAENQTIWRHQLSELGRQFRCLTFDFVGVGKSDIRGSDAQRYVQIDQHVKDFLKIMERMHITQAHFVGHGLGGNIGALACVLKPDLFTNLHFIDMAPKYVRSHDFEGYFHKDEFELLWKQLAQDYLSWSEFLPTNDELTTSEHSKLGSLYSSLKKLRPDFAQGALRIKYDLDMREDLRRLTQPLHFYHSLKESVVALWLSEYYAEQVPNAHVQILNSEGRRPQLTSPDEVNQLLLKYLIQNSDL
jgi:sigma-B regulation protein RsbQ